MVEVVGASNVITDPDMMAGYLTDWMGGATGVADAVVRPRSTAQVAAVVRICGAAQMQICVQGGNTGLVGGSVPPPQSSGAGMVLLSTTRMTDIDEVDTVGRCVGVQAGATVAAIDARASQAGLSFGVDLASRDTATAGGIVATNAGGIRVIRHGSTRRQILGIEAVLADGSVVRRWSALVKDDVGYDLPGLMAGSEGTLAIITRVLFRLVAPPRRTLVTVVALDRIDAAIALIAAASDAGLCVEAAEFMTEEGIALVGEFGCRRPVATRATYYLLLEVSVPGDDQAGTVEASLLSLLEQADGALDAVLEPGPARALWEVRESHTESIARSTVTPVVKLDVAFPIRELAMAIDELAALPARYDDAIRSILFGHVGDGNVHVNLLDVPGENVASVIEAVFSIVARRGGSISAEHGVGRAKVAWTHLGRDRADLAAMRAIKKALDPSGLLNPGVIFD